MNGYAYDNSCTQFHMEHSSRIAQHYAHAIEKHPHFCDWSPLDIGSLYKMYIPMRLDRARKALKYCIENGCITWEDIFDCEMWEALEALAHGDTSHAVEELYDCITVCLRTIDVLEGRQKLGKPEEALPPCTCGGEAATVERGTEPEGFAIMCSRCFRKTALHPTLALAEDEWRKMFPDKNNKTTKENNK